MAIQDKTTLKSYFETGDRPTQAQFGDLIDTLVAQNAQGAIAVGAVNLDTAATPTGQEGQIRWNATDKCAEVVQDGGVVLQVGQEITVRARNTTGSTLANGVPVYVNGATGNRPTVARADADAFLTSSTLIGLVTDSAGIANNSDGHVTVFGLVRDLDTSAYSEGATLYLSDGASGTLTATKPTATSSYIVRVGYVTRSHASQGVILVSPQYMGSVTGDAVVNAASANAARTVLGLATTNSVTFAGLSVIIPGGGGPDITALSASASLLESAVPIVSENSLTVNGSLIAQGIANYANDAAADADSSLPSGGLYRTTAGGRTVFRKP